MPYGDVPAFMGELRQRDGVAARALEFAILTGTRTSEVLNAEWREIDGGVWTIPAGRMKARQEHRVPLSPRTLEILSGLPPKGARIFEGHTAHMAMLKVLQRMGHAGLTVHGFRAAFKTWASECTSFPAEVTEQALAHTIASAVERAYRRGDLFEKRRRLMGAWADYCGKPAPSGEVVPWRAAAKSVG